MVRQNYGTYRRKPDVYKSFASAALLSKKKGSVASLEPIQRNQVSIGSNEKNSESAKDELIRSSIKKEVENIRLRKNTSKMFTLPKLD